MNEWISGAIYAPLGGIIVALIGYYREKRKDRNEEAMSVVQSAHVVQGMALEMLEPLRNQVEHLQKVLDNLKAQVVSLTKELDQERVARITAETERDQYKNELAALRG